jgi:hypothetical protein
VLDGFVVADTLVIKAQVGKTRLILKQLGGGRWQRRGAWGRGRARGRRCRAALRPVPRYAA